MPPKKKTSAAAVPSTSIPPPPEQMSGGEDAGGRTDFDEGAHDAARSKGKAAQTSTSALVPRPSQEAQERQRHGTRSTIRLLGQDQAGGSRGAQDQHACQRASTSETRSPGRDNAPSNIVRSPSISRSSHRSPVPPTTPAEALARAQLLLDYPPMADKINEWRATVQSLVAVSNKDDPRPAGPSGPHSVEPPHASGGRTGGAAAIVHSPPPRQLPPVSIRRDDACDNISIASCDPWTHRD